jgi:hypothetical protein
MVLLVVLEHLVKDMLAEQAALTHHILVLAVAVLVQ